jgi:prepilin-type N-terminal cleavage/methylation domain-containing protein
MVRATGKMMKLTTVVRGRLRGSRGFTLIELLVVMLVAGIIAAGMLSLYLGVTRSFADTGNRIVNQDDARTAVNQMTRYLRAASSSAANLTSVSDAIALASPQEVVFYADINGNGYPDKVRYYLTGNTLKMATVAPNTSTSPPTYPAYTTDGIVVMNGIQNGATAIFTYYQMNPNYATNPVPSNDNLVVMTNPTSASDLAKILAVGVTLYVNEAPKLSKGNVKLESLAQIRQRYNGGLGGS